MTAGPVDSQDLIDEFVGAAHGDLARVQTLLAEHPSLVHARSSWDETALGAAAQTGQAEIAELLLDAGAALDIFTAIMLGRSARVRAMLTEQPGLVKETGAHGFPILYFAAIGGRSDLAQLLTEFGADMNAGGGVMTALHGAVLFDQHEMVRWLVAHGANPRSLDSNGKTPFDLAVELSRTDILKTLGADPSP